jgi:hypothetical protein
VTPKRSGWVCQLRAVPLRSGNFDFVDKLTDVLER